MESILLFVVFAVVSIFAHQFSDHVVQTDAQAVNKAKPGREGWSAILLHVWSYHLVLFGMLLITVVVLNLPVTVLGFISALLFSAVTHAILDRRWPVRWILCHTGSPAFAEMSTPLNGMYLGDQGLHYICLWVSSLLFAVL